MKNKCLICEDVAELQPGTIGRVPGFESYEYEYFGKACIKVRKELSVILLVRKVLGVSQACLESLLRHHGDPTNWGLLLCPPCNRVFIEAEFIHDRLLKLHDEFDKLVTSLRKRLSLTGSLLSNVPPREGKRKPGRRRKGRTTVVAKTAAADFETTSNPRQYIRQDVLKGKGISSDQVFPHYPHVRSQNNENFVQNVEVKMELMDCFSEHEQEVLETEAANKDGVKEPEIRDQVDDFQDDYNHIDDDNNDEDYVPDSINDNDNPDNDTDEHEKKNSDEAETDEKSASVDPFTGPQPIKLKKGCYKCPICERKAVSKSSAHGHILRAHYNQSKPFHCHICRARFKRDVALRQHLDDEHNCSATPLDDSDEVLDEDEPFNADEPNKVRNRTFKCEICPKKPKHNVLYKSLETLEAHKKRVHFGVKRPYNCKICSKSFKIHCMLRRHMYVHKRREREMKIGLEEQPFCNECNRSFKNEATLRAHWNTKVHLKPLEYPFQCELCPKGFFQKQSLTNHHAQEHFEQLDLQPFKCSFCGSILSSLRALDHHTRIRHTKDTKFRCEPCGLGFMMLKPYNRHMSVVHAKEKPFLCSYCPKRFTSKSHLETHIRVHTGEKPFKCPHCGKEYSDRPTYRRHLETHGEQTYTCSICENKHFKIWHSYRTHMRTHNQEIYKKPPPNKSVNTNTISKDDSVSSSEDFEKKQIIETDAQDNVGNLTSGNLDLC